MCSLGCFNTPLRNIKLTIEYDGTAYHGWQVQPNVVTVQGAIEAVLQRITREPVQVVGSGRTDSGVHAAGQAANFHTRSKMTARAFRQALNALLPHDIVVTEATEVAPEFHARYDAVRRIYRYTLLNRSFSSAFHRNIALHHPGDLGVEPMDAMSQALIGTHDFSSFQKTGSTRKDPTCTVFDTRWWRDGDWVHFEIEADSFLRGMVRAIVGSCLRWHTDVGPVATMQQVLAAKNRAAAGPSAPAHGLCLVRVEY